MHPALPQAHIPSSAEPNASTCFLGMRPLRSECLAWVPDRDEGASPPPQLGLLGQNLATWYVLSPLTSPKREMKGLAESPPGPWGQAGTAVPIHLPLGSVSGRFPWRGKALRQLLPCQLPHSIPHPQPPGESVTADQLRGQGAPCASRLSLPLPAEGPFWLLLPL